LKNTKFNEFGTGYVLFIIFNSLFFGIPLIFIFTIGLNIDNLLITIIILILYYIFITVAFVFYFNYRNKRESKQKQELRDCDDRVFKNYIKKKKSNLK
jgi:O-antigen/teichoic acid export membrane protein